MQSTFSPLFILSTASFFPFKCLKTTPVQEVFLFFLDPLNHCTHRRTSTTPGGGEKRGGNRLIESALSADSKYRARGRIKTAVRQPSADLLGIGGLPRGSMGSTPIIFTYINMVSHSCPMTHQTGTFGMPFKHTHVEDAAKKTVYYYVANPKGDPH